MPRNGGVVVRNASIRKPRDPEWRDENRQRRVGGDECHAGPCRTGERSDTDVAVL